MKTTIFCLSGWVAGLMSVALLSGQEKTTDEVAPLIQSGFATLSADELAEGWLLLLDGRTLFGWGATPLKKEIREGTLQPTIRISQGETRITTSVPIQMKTELLLSRPWRMTLTYRTDGGTRAELVLHDMTHNMYPKRYTYPLPESPETKTVRVEGTGASGDAILFDDQPIEPAGIIDGRTGPVLTVNQGTLIVESMKFCPVMRPLFSTDLSEWKTQGDISVEVRDAPNPEIHLTGGSGSLESRDEWDDFYLSVEYRENVLPNNSGLFFRTIPGSKMDGYECQLNNSPPENDRPKFLGNDTGSIFRRTAARRLVAETDGWNALTVMAEADLFRSWVNGIPAVVWVDSRPAHENPRQGRRFKRGTVQLQGHDPGTDISFRKIAVADSKVGAYFAAKQSLAVKQSLAAEKSLAATPALQTPTEPSPVESVGGLSDDNRRYENFRAFDETWKQNNPPLTDWHIHLRGGMTPEKAVVREEETGVKSGVLENAGRDWPLSTDEKILAMIQGVKRLSPEMPVGIQVNDRDWFTAISPDVLSQLDFVLADTMIMGTDENGSPQKLWLLPPDYDADADVWMDQYVAHNLQILDEPISILANPTYLPAFIADRYDELWTDARMATIIDKAVAHGIALEIQAESPFPSERFLRMATEKGVTFSFGTNNHDAVLKDLARWQSVLESHRLENIKR